MKTDSEIANEAILEPISKIAEKLNIDDYEQYGKYIAKLPLKYINEEKVQNSKLILVTAMSPTKAGIGKTTVSVGLSMALNKIGKNCVAALREPSLGPCFGMKGGACGGGYSQVLPMDKINLHFTGDFHAVTTAHNMIAALMDNYLYQNKIQLKQTLWKRVLDINDRSLRQIITGLGPNTNGGLHNSGFDITPASEIMAILCLSKDLDDLRHRLDNILLGYKEDGSEFILSELNCTGSIVALLKDAMMPNLVQTIENTPGIVHGGPFANIAHGCNTIVATKMALSLGDYCVTEAGFGADLGAEKFFDIKCRQLGRYPDTVVLVVTIAGIKEQGNGDLSIGMQNVLRHIKNIQTMGLNIIVAINRYPNDIEDDYISVKSILSNQYGEISPVKAIVCSEFVDGGNGCIDLANEVIEECENHCLVKYNAIYKLSDILQDKIENVCKKIYNAAIIQYSTKAIKMIKTLEENDYYKEFPVCIAKTQYSFTDDPKVLGAPKDFTFTINDIVINRGSGFIVAIAGDMMRMPGLPKKPAALNIDVDENGKIIGLS